VVEHLFVDTSFLVARFNRRDRRHGAASRWLQEQREPGSTALRLILSDYVFDETITTLRFLSRRHDVAATAGRAIMGSGTLRMARIEPSVFEAAWSLFVDRSDKEWSFTDCTSFALMEGLGIRKALSFDENFRQAGFATLP